MHTEYNGQPEGHGVVIWPGWQDNPARYSPQPDVMPIPVAPVRFVSWPMRSMQLSNGWQNTNMGKKTPYNYLYQAYASNSGPGYPAPLKGNRQQPTGSPTTSASRIQNTVMANVAQNNPGPGPGNLAPGVNLGARTYYG